MDDAAVVVEVKQESHTEQPTKWAMRILLSCVHKQKNSHREDDETRLGGDLKLFTAFFHTHPRDRWLSEIISHYKESGIYYRVFTLSGNK